MSTEAALLKSKLATQQVEDLLVPQPLTKEEFDIFQPIQTSMPYQIDLNGIKCVYKYELPFSALAGVIHRRIEVPTGSKFISFMILPYLEYQKIFEDGTPRKFCFDMDRTPKNQEMADMKEKGTPRLVFALYVAVFTEKALNQEIGIVIAKTRESLTNFNVDYYIGSVAKNFTTHYHAFTLKGS